MVYDVITKGGGKTSKRTVKTKALAEKEKARQKKVFGKYIKHINLSIKKR